MFAPERYSAALQLAIRCHGAQQVPGTQLPYLAHITWVTGELIAALPDSGFDGDLAVTCALLHDTIEDSQVPGIADEIERQFGTPARAGVLALTKDATLPKADRMPDSLRRIRSQPREIWAVKLADRITNLATPPKHWTIEKCIGYRAEAITILEALGEANVKLATRMRARIAAYPSL
ncbi:MAG: HD domain-containing protein [Kofleriaceae bacterium]